MEKLTVKNFLNLNSIELDLGKINIIIGPQANGKSIIAKLIYFFKNFFIKYRFSIITKQKKAEFDKTIIANFKEIFPEYSWKGQEFELVYHFGKYYVSIHTKAIGNGKHKLFIQYSEYLVTIRRKLLFEYEKQSIEYAEEENKDSSRSNAEEYISKIFSQYVLEGNQVSSLDLLTFIPAGRSFFASIESNVFSFLSGNITIDYFLKEFGSAYEMVKRLYHIKKSINQLDQNDSIDELINQIIVGTYVYDKGQDWIYSQKNRRINLSNSSSGQQEALPMALILAILPFVSQTNRIFLIEEPEAHLFPTSQKHIVSLISLVFNLTNKKHKFFITTHSPYILTAFNNLIQAGNTLKALKEKGDQNNLIEKLYKIVPINQILDINYIRVYTIKDGVIENLKNEEINLIDTNIIDDVSNEFSRTFENLLELELGE